MKNFATLIACFISLQAIAQTPLITIPFERYGDHLFIKVSVTILNLLTLFSTPVTE